MSKSVYKMNKGINKPFEFKGLKAQYISPLTFGRKLGKLGKIRHFSNFDSAFLRNTSKLTNYSPGKR